MLFIMDKLQVLEPISAEIGLYVFYAGIISIPAGVWMLRRHRNMNREFIDAWQKMSGERDSGSDKLQQSLVIGMCVAESPAMLGFCSYVMSGDLEKASVLMAASFILGYFFRPELPRNF